MADSHDPKILLSRISDLERQLTDADATRVTLEQTLRDVAMCCHLTEDPRVPIEDIQSRLVPCLREWVQRIDDAEAARGAVPQENVLSAPMAAGLLITLKAECETQHARAEAAEAALGDVATQAVAREQTIRLGYLSRIAALEAEREALQREVERLDVDRLHLEQVLSETAEHVDDALRERDALRQAIWPDATADTEPHVWVSLALAHREDSETVDVAEKDAAVIQNRELQMQVLELTARLEVQRSVPRV